MSMTIIVTIDDEEHTLTIHPGDNLIDILDNMLGDINTCSFTVNGKTAWSLDDLSEELENNTKIEVTHRRTRGAPVSLGLRGFPCELRSKKNPSRPVIQIESVHISCSSDSYDINENMAGLIVYSFDNKQFFEMNGHRCRTGYILIKKSSEILKVKSNQGQVHGSLFKWFFGIEPDHRFIGAGFSLHEKKFKFNSGVFNATNDDYHDQEHSMSRSEIQLIKYALDELYKNHKWKTQPTLSISNMQQSAYNPGDDLPYQNHPKSMINKNLR